MEKKFNEEPKWVTEFNQMYRNSEPLTPSKKRIIEFIESRVIQSDNFKKFTLLKESQTIATDNTLPIEQGETAKTPKQILDDLAKDHRYGTWSLLLRNLHPMSIEEWTINAMQEYAKQERQKAIDEAINSVIRVAGIKYFLNEDGQSACGDVIQELEKLR